METVDELPDAVRVPLGRFEEGLQAFVQGEAVTEEELLQALHRALSAASAARWEHESSSWDLADAEVDELPNRNIAKLRDEAEVSQGRLAAAMRQLGFRWSRSTVAAIETMDPDAATYRRRVSLDELVGLAAAFGEPVVSLLLPPDDSSVIVNVPGGSLPGPLLRELFLGRDGQLGTGGALWEVAARLAAPSGEEQDSRPALALWRNRHAGS